MNEDESPFPIAQPTLDRFSDLPMLSFLHRARKFIYLEEVEMGLWKIAVLILGLQKEEQSAIWNHVEVVHAAPFQDLKNKDQYGYQKYFYPFQ